MSNVNPDKGARSDARSFASPAIEEGPEEQEGLVEIHLMHSITHDGVEYGPGVHRLSPDLADIFMAIRHPAGDTGQIQIAKPFKREAIMGSVKKAADADAGKKSKQQQN
jgi:hypothetical protein